MNSGSIHDPIRGRIDRLAEIQSKSDRLLGPPDNQRLRTEHDAYEELINSAAVLSIAPVLGEPGSMSQGWLLSLDGKLLLRSELSRMAAKAERSVLRAVQIPASSIICPCGFAVRRTSKPRGHCYDTKGRREA